MGGSRWPRPGYHGHLAWYLVGICSDPGNPPPGSQRYVAWPIRGPKSELLNTGNSDFGTSAGQTQYIPGNPPPGSQRCLVWPIRGSKSKFLNTGNSDLGTLAGQTEYILGYPPPGSICGLTNPRAPNQISLTCETLIFGTLAGQTQYILGNPPPGSQRYVVWPIRAPQIRVP